MKCTLKANGRLRHHFWGDYSATIVLAFDSPEDALLAQCHLPDWKVGEKSKNVLVWFGGGEKFDACKELLVSFGADADKIDSVRFSVDHGEPFSISLTVEYEDPNQTYLFGA